jgi:hypothetical protein
MSAIDTTNLARLGLNAQASSNSHKRQRRFPAASLEVLRDMLGESVPPGLWHFALDALPNIDRRHGQRIRHSRRLAAQ